MNNDRFLCIYAFQLKYIFSNHFHQGCSGLGAYVGNNGHGIQLWNASPSQEIMYTNVHTWGILGYLVQLLACFLACLCQETREPGKTHSQTGRTGETPVT